jgi:hypothetical protein
MPTVKQRICDLILGSKVEEAKNGLLHIWTYHIAGGDIVDVYHRYDETGKSIAYSFYFMDETYFIWKHIGISDADLLVSMKGFIRDVYNQEFSR